MGLFYGLDPQLSKIPCCAPEGRVPICGLAYGTNPNFGNIINIIDPSKNNENVSIDMLQTWKGELKELGIVYT